MRAPGRPALRPLPLPPLLLLLLAAPWGRAGYSRPLLGLWAKV
uniref:Interleukin 20 receptor subunit alpha n=1 Tax=Homo sapiens TaxID=9606 RepID=A0A0U1RQS0_HUMAN